MLACSFFAGDEMLTRGQIEWAIAKATDRTQGPGGEPRHDLKMKLKRLLDLDRKKGTDAAQAWPEFRRFAFLEGGLPGKGLAISYTPYDAFALFLGLHLLGSNVPQMAVIRLLRRIRLDLAREHERILRLSPERLAQSKHGLERKIKGGLLVKEPRKMVFLISARWGRRRSSLSAFAGRLAQAGQYRPFAGRVSRCRRTPHACLATGPDIRADQPDPSAGLVARTCSPDPSRTFLT